MDSLTICIANVLARENDLEIENEFKHALNRATPFYLNTRIQSVSIYLMKVYNDSYSTL